MVDIDEEVVRVCRRHLSTFHCGAFEDPRTELTFEDAWDFLLANPERFDAVIMDITDPLPGSPAERLYGTEFLTLVRSSLREHGTLSSLAGDAGGDLRQFIQITAAARSVFDDVKPYVVGIPMFWGPWGFLVAGKQQLPALAAVEIDENIPSEVVRGLKCYDGITHQGLFSLPKHIREKL
jgi:spermidine synthase